MSFLSRSCSLLRSRNPVLGISKVEDIVALVAIFFIDENCSMITLSDVEPFNHPWIWM